MAVIIFKLLTLEGSTKRALTRTFTVRDAGTRPPSLTIFLISDPSFEPYKGKNNLSITYFGNFSAHEVAGRNVCVTKLFNQLGTLCSLTGGRATEDKCYFRIS